MIELLIFALMAIIFTSLSSMLAHHKRQNINWYLIKVLLPGLWLGGLRGAYFAINLVVNYCKDVLLSTHY